MSSYFGDTKITNLDIGYGGTTDITSSTTAKANVYGGKLSITNYTSTATLGHTDSNYFRISSPVPTYFDTTGISIVPNSLGINFRQYDTYTTSLNYKTNDNEALCLDICNPVTSFIIRTKTPTADSEWTSVTPTFQAKNQRVTINKLIENGTNADYNLDVNGTANATTIYENGTSLNSKYVTKSGDTMTGSLNFGSESKIRVGTQPYYSELQYDRLDIIDDSNGYCTTIEPGKIILTQQSSDVVVLEPSTNTYNVGGSRIATEDQIPTALKCPNSLSITVGGTVTSYDGSSAKSVTLGNAAKLNYTFDSSTKTLTFTTT